MIVDPTTPQTGPINPQNKAGVQQPTGRRILIVEDEKPLSHALAMKLKHDGFETDLATNGAEAIEKLKEQSFAMVLLDLIMPVVDGFGVLEEIRSRKLKTPVIILSNLGQDEDRAKAKELGAVDYFVKSNTPIADIISRVKDVIR
ncbi:MAG: response regulator [Candidatus Peribacteraceae bacterium]|nr:response regulator [Candidatus Peribacteraceae bacterium]